MVCRICADARRFHVLAPLPPSLFMLLHLLSPFCPPLLCLPALPHPMSLIGDLKSFTAAKEKLIGWYHTGPKLGKNDLQIDELMARYTPNPCLCIIGTSCGSCFCLFIYFPCAQTQSQPPHARVLTAPPFNDTQDTLLVLSQM